VIYELFANICVNHPNRVAIKHNGTECTYSELDRLASSFAIRMDAADPLNIQRGVYVSAPAGIGYVAAILAASKSSRFFIPIPKDPSAPRASRILDSGVAGIVLEIAGDGRNLKSVRSQPGHICLEDTAYVMFTSGSTGSPKGVVVAENNVRAYLTGISQRYSFTSTDKFSFLFQTTFDLSINDVILCFYAGGTLCIPSFSENVLLDEFVQKNQITVFSAVPSKIVNYLSIRNRVKSAPLSSIRHSLFCGEPLRRDIAQKWGALTRSVVSNLYGPTEATIAVSAHDYCESEDFPIVPIGTPFHGTAFELIENREIGETELVIRGEQVAQGYVARNEDSSNGFVTSIDGSRSFATGDIVSHKDQTYHFHHRIGSMMKVNGLRVERGEIESYCAIFANFSAVAASKIKDQKTELEFVVIFLLKPYSIDIVSLNRALHDKLPRELIPRKAISVDGFPLNASGKLDYKKIDELAEDLSQ
jgi:D-alanine--poly(phosphoribitol) ligase subunit 1